MRTNQNIFSHIDWILVLLYLTLVLIGWFNIYAAVYDENHQNIFDISQRYGKQLIWIAASMVIILITLMLDPRLFSQFSYLIYAIVIFFVLVVSFMGREISGSRAWFHLGSIAIQPAEFAKVATALALSSYLSRMDLNLKKIKTWLTIGLIIFLPMALILFQHDTGSALVFLSFFLVLYRFGMNKNIVFIFIAMPVTGVLALLIPKEILLGVALLVSAIAFLYTRRRIRNLLAISGIFILSAGYILSVDYAFHHILQSHHRQRINVLLGKTTDLKGAGYNVNQSLIAIGSGKFFGKGYLQGTQTKYNFVPEQSTDFIFCTIGEEWGFTGSLIVILIYLGLFYRLTLIAERQRSKFSKVYGYCVASILFVHFAINIGMALGLMPVIGIPLPFLSYGGSSLWAFTILLFLFIRLDAYRYELV